MAIELGPDYNDYEVDTGNFCKRDWLLIKRALESYREALNFVINMDNLVNPVSKESYKRDVEDMTTLIKVIESGSEVEDEEEDS